MSHIHGAIWWSELTTRDVDAAQAYYRRICGWRFSVTPSADGGDYFVAHLGDQPVAGLLDLALLPDHEDTPAQWVTYIAVDDIDEALTRTRTAGGQVLREGFDVPDVGRIAMVQDSVGALLGLIRPVRAG